MGLFQQPANALIVMTKAPEPGQSKTRLVPPLSFAEAADLARALLLDQLNNLAQLSGARLFIAFTPETAAGFFERFAAQGFASFLQQGHSLGERMSHAFQYLFDGGFGNIILIGSDLPALSLALFDQAYAWLGHGEADVVLGPSTDGGYYLIGMNRLISDIFQDMSWSRDDVLARTTEKLAGLGVRYELLPLGYDIDTSEDLRRLQSHCDQRDVSMKNTATLLHELRRRGKV